jgi:hypothetical protein
VVSWVTGDWNGGDAELRFQRELANRGERHFGRTVVRPARLIVQTVSRSGLSDPQAGP